MRERAAPLPCLVLAMAWSLLCAAGPADAQDGAVAAWDYLPLVGYDSEGLAFALRPPGGAAGWTVVDDHGMALASSIDAQGEILSATIPPGPGRRVLLSKGESQVALRLVHPGEGAGLGLDTQRRPTQQGELSILVLPRVEAQADRRWAVLGLVEKPDVDPCTLLLDESAVPWGEPAITAQICVAQRLDPNGRGVLVRLAGADRLAGWKHREYRQMVAWLVADLLQRGAKRVVLVEPIAPAAEAGALAPLRLQIADVGHSYHCQVVAASSLCKDALWEIAPGVLGTSLNARGRSALTELLASWWHSP